MCRSMADIQSTAAEIRRGKKEDRRRRRKKLQGKNIMVCPITKGDHKQWQISAFFEKRPLIGKLSKFCSERIHRDTNRRVVFKFREIWLTEIGTRNSSGDEIANVNFFTATSSTTFTQCAPEATEYGEITQNKGHYAVQGHSRFTDFGTN